MSDSSGQIEADPGTPLRVAWVGTSETIETFGCMLGPLAVGLMDELVEVLLICPRRTALTDLPVPPVEVLPHGRLGYAIFSTSEPDRVAGEMRTRKAQLIHALDVDSAPFARRLANAVGTEYLVTCTESRDGRRLGLMHRRAAAVLAMAEPVMANLIMRRVAPASRIRLLQPAAHQVRRPRLFVDKERSLAMVAAGSAHKEKDLSAVIKAFAKLRRTDYDCRFFVTSDVRGERRLRKEVERLGLREDLTFVDRRPISRLPGIFKAADVYISASANKHVDIHCLLAMSAGISVLAARGTVGDFLLDGRTAMLFPAGDTGEIFARLGGLLKDPELAQSLAAGALSYVRAKHSPARMVSALSAIYRQVLDSPAHS